MTPETNAEIARDLSGPCDCAQGRITLCGSCKLHRSILAALDAKDREREEAVLTERREWNKAVPVVTRTMAGISEKDVQAAEVRGCRWGVSSATEAVTALRFGDNRVQFKMAAQRCEASIRSIDPAAVCAERRAGK